MYREVACGAAVARDGIIRVAFPEDRGSSVYHCVPLAA